MGASVAPPAARNAAPRAWAESLERRILLTATLPSFGRIASGRVIEPRGAHSSFAVAANANKPLNLAAGRQNGGGEPLPLLDSAGNLLASGTAGEAIPGAPDLLNATDSGLSGSDNLTNFNNASPAKALQLSVPGTTAGATVTVYVGGAAVGSAVASGATTVVTTDGATRLLDGTYSVTARQTPPGQGESPDSVALSVTIDTTAPARPAPPDLQATSDSGVSSTDNVTNFKRPVFDVTAGPFFRVYRGASQVGGNYLTGTTFQPPLLPVLPDGSDPFTVTAVDAAGNESAPSAPLNVVIDTAGPTVKSYVAPDIFAAGATVYQFTAVYADNTAIDVTTLSADPVRVSDQGAFNANANFVSVDVNSNGTPRAATYQLTPPGGSWDSTDDRRYSLTPTGSFIRDIAGNLLSASSSGSFNVGILVAPMLDSDSGRSSRDLITNFNNASPAKALSFLVLGTVPGAAVTVYADGVAIASGVAPGISMIIAADGTIPLADGVHLITARQTPAGGGAQTVASPALSITIDTVAPVPPGAPDLQAASDSGVSNADNVTKVNTPRFDVNPGPGGTYYRVFRDGTLVSGSYETSPSFTSAALADGTYSFTARAVDEAGNESQAGAAVSVVIDSVGPAVTGAAFVDQPGGQAFQFTFSEEVPGTLDAADLIVRRLPNGPDLAIASVSYDDAANAATFYFAEPVPDGDYSAKLLASPPGAPAVSDTAGNPLAGGDYVVQFTRMAGLSAAPGSAYTLAGPADNKLLTVSAGTVTLNENLSSVYPLISLDVTGGTVVFAVDQQFQNVSLSGNGRISIG
jgi:hypothetical protein